MTWLPNQKLYTGLHTSFSLSRNFSTALASHSPRRGWHQQGTSTHSPRSQSWRLSAMKIDVPETTADRGDVSNLNFPFFLELFEFLLVRVGNVWIFVPKQTPISIAHRFCKWSSFCTFHSCTAAAGIRQLTWGMEEAWISVNPGAKQFVLRIAAPKIICQIYGKSSVLENVAASWSSLCHAYV